MRFLLQRVSRASVSVDGGVIAAIESGLLVLVGFGKGDTEETIAPLLEKLLQLRIFSDERGRFMHSLIDLKGSLLLVPQFTLYADTSRGRRPDFGDALHPDAARTLFEKLLVLSGSFGLSAVASGRFGAHMQVALENDGPVTILLES